MFLGDLKNRKKTVTIEVDLEALIDEFKKEKVDIKSLHYLLFDEEIAFRLLKCRAKVVWWHLPSKFRAKEEFMLEYLEQCEPYFMLHELTPQLLSDKKIVSNILKKTHPGFVGDILRIDKELLTSPEFVFENIQYAADLYDLDDYYVISRNSDGGRMYRELRNSVDNSKIRANFEITLKGVKLYGYRIYMFASESLKSNGTIVLALLEKEPMAYFKLTDYQKNEPAYIKMALRGNPDIFAKLDEEKRNSFEYAIIAVEEDADMFENVGEKLRASREFVEKAFEKMTLDEKRENIYFITDSLIKKQYITDI